MTPDETPDFKGIAARLDHMIGLAKAGEIEWPNEDCAMVMSIAAASVLCISRQMDEPKSEMSPLLDFYIDCGSKLADWVERNGGDEIAPELASLRDAGRYIAACLSKAFEAADARALH
jgi:hypothetical protein